MSRYVCYETATGRIRFVASIPNSQQPDPNNLPSGCAFMETDSQIVADDTHYILDGQITERPTLDDVPDEVDGEVDALVDVGADFRTDDTSLIEKKGTTLRLKQRGRPYDVTIESFPFKPKRILFRNQMAAEAAKRKRQDRSDKMKAMEAALVLQGFGDITDIPDEASARAILANYRAKKASGGPKPK